MPKISVIVPNFNHAPYLTRRMESILAQTISDYELIMLDDKSTDRSAEILKQFHREIPGSTLHINEVNSGSPFHQWNKGVEISSGEYIWIAESDDYCEPQLLEQLSSMLDQNPNVGIAYAQSTLVDEQDNQISSYQKNLDFIYPEYNWSEDFVKNGKDACRDWLLFHNPIPNASGALFRKSAFISAGMADPRMRLNGDWFLYAKILSRYDLAFHAEHLNYFRVHKDTQRERSRATYKVYEEILQINNYIRSEIPQARSNADKALTKVGRWWTGSLPYQRWKKGSLEGNLNLYRIFGKYLNWLWLRILYNFAVVNLKRFLIWLGLLDQVKAMRRKMFPGKYFEQ